MIDDDDDGDNDDNDGDNDDNDGSNKRKEKMPLSTSCLWILAASQLMMLLL